VLTGAGNWRGVTGTLSLPTLSVPPGVQLPLANGQNFGGYVAWVAVQGTQFLQAEIQMNLDVFTNPPSTVFNSPTAYPYTYPLIAWYYPTPPMGESAWNPGSVFIKNAPPMKSGDLVQMYCGFFTGLGGATWGSVYYLFYNDLEPSVLPEPVSYKGPKHVDEIPILMNYLLPGPPDVSGEIDQLDWILEFPGGSTATNIAPMFSPVTFTQAIGYGEAEGVTGDPVNGQQYAWPNVNIPVTVNLASETVSIVAG
jgi:hypothetical protein